jgi:acyl-CoA synthetase (AMP-forming)/AMP-acid ligase II
MQDSVSVENALYADPRVLEAAAVGVPDRRLGEVVVAIICVKPAFRGQVSEEDIMTVARQKFVIGNWCGHFASNLISSTVFPNSHILSWSSYETSNSVCEQVVRRRESY